MLKFAFWYNFGTLSLIFHVVTVEVIASNEHIASELQRGVPVTQIHDALLQSGRVSVTDNSLRRQVQFIRDEPHPSVLSAIPVSSSYLYGPLR